MKECRAFKAEHGTQEALSGGSFGVIISTKAEAEMVAKVTTEVGGTWKKGGRRSWFWTMGEIASFWKKARTGIFGGQKIKVRLLPAS